MQTIAIGDTALFPVILGTVPFGTKLSQAESFALMDAFAAAGGNMIDTANAYGFKQGVGSASERTVAAWLKTAHASMLLATKGAHPRDGVLSPRVRPDCIHADVAESLDVFERVIDLYWLHRDDPAYPVEPLMDALFAEQDEKRVGLIGASNWSPERIALANAYALQCGRTGFAASQILYALCMPAQKDDPTLVWMDERADGAFYARESLPVFAYSSQSHGYIAKVTENRSLGSASVFDSPDNRRRAAACADAAREAGITPNAAALAYVLHQGFPCAAVVGPMDRRQLYDSMAAASVRLSPTRIAALRNA